MHPNSIQTEPKLVKICQNLVSQISSISRDLLIGLVWGGDGMVWQSYTCRGHKFRKRVNFEDVLDVHALQYHYHHTKLNVQVGFASSVEQSVIY